MSISIAEAKEALSSITSFDQLRVLIAQLDVTSTGTKTVLYSGGFGNNVDSRGIALSLARSDSDIRIVDNTSAAEFLDLNDNKELKNWLLEHGGDPDIRGSEANKFLFDVNYGNGLGAWATVSKNFVSSPTTEGNVRVIAPFADPERVFAEVELKELLNNPGVNEIDGRSKADYQRLATAATAAGRNGHSVVLSAVIDGSGDAVSRLQIPTDKAGVVQTIDKTPVTIGTTNYFNDGTVTGQPIPDGMHSSSATNVIITARGDEKVSLPKNTDPKTHLENAHFANEQLKTYTNEQKAAATAAGDSVALAKAEKVLNKLGIAGDAIALGFAINEANAAYVAGDTNKAIDTMTKWGLEFTGGVAGGVAAAALVSSALAPMYLMGPVGIIAAGGLSLLAGIAGGVLGGDAFVKLFGGMLGIDEDGSDIPKPLPPDLPPPPPRDPLALDLNGDGIVKTLPISRDIHFDLDNSGFAERTSWVAPEDGLLVLDRNNNNFIDGGAELFGTETLLQNGKYAQHGFEALAEFDINKDGVLDTNDSIYSSLRVWRDANSNGIAEASELKKLADLNIKSVGTAYTNIDIRDANNVEHREAGSFTYNNATKGITNTLWFESDRRITTPVTELQGNITIPDAIKKLPNVVGFGNTYSLHHAMAVDSSGELQKKVQRFSVELNPEKRRLLLREILVLWTKTDTVVAGSRGNKVDATSLAIMESFWGQPALQAEPLGVYADSVNKAYKQLEQSVYTQLMAVTHMRDLMSLTDFSEVNGQLTADYSVAIDVLSGNFLAANEFATLKLVEYIETIRGVNPYSDSLYHSLISDLEVAANLLSVQPREAMLSAFHSHDEIISGTFNSDRLEGFGGNDILNGDIGDDELKGGDGNDRLYGEFGADTLSGGAGSDLLIGGSGNDIYLYNKGDGVDVISENAGTDTLKFGDGITSDNIIVRHNMTDVIITTEDSGQITINSLLGYSGEENKDNLIEYFSFADNSVFTFEQFKKLATIGSDQNDILLGFNSADVITGKDGHDKLYGFSGNDTLDGGSGDDELAGGAGNDTYVFNVGDGSDVLDESSGFDSVQLGQGINESDVGVHVSAAGDLEITLPATNKITVKGMVNNSNGTIHLDRSIEQLTFANGATWDIDRIQRQAMLGTNKSDTIYGFNLNGVIDGKRGADRLYGRDGNDTYLFNKGDGIDVISDSGGTDTIRFGAGINPEDLLIVRRSAAGAEITGAATENAIGTDWVFLTRYGDQITLVNANANATNAIEKIEFANGDVWNVDQIQQRIQYTLNQSNIYIGTNQRFEQLGYYGFPESDTTFIGIGGNDQLLGGMGNDTFIGGDGINVMYGGAGNDNYVVHTSNKHEQVIKSFSDRGDRIFLADDISPADVTVRIIRDTLRDLHLDQSGLRGYNGILTPINIALTTNDGFLLTIENVFDYYNLTRPYAGPDLTNRSEKSGHIEFLNGTRWDYETLIKLALTGTDQIDRILGTIENDEAQGKAGADVIETFDGNDILDGGTGGDLLSGGNGDDTYLYSLGDGNDEIYDLGGKDTLKFGAGIKKENVLFAIDNQKMIVSFNNSADKITISNWDSDNYSAGIIENVVFANGDILDFDPYNLPRNLLGTNNDDHLIGYYGNDTLEGLSGNDTLWGGAGNDLYIQGSSSGHDHISDSGGTDTIYLKDLSSQQSDLVTIYFNQNLVLTVEINAPDGMYAVSSYLDYSQHNIGDTLDFKSNASFIENVKFSDGAVWDADKILREATENSISKGVLVGTDTNDVLAGTGLSEILFAGVGDDQLTGGAGDDTLLGKSGNDTYRYARGDGSDVIKEESGNDTLELAAGINPEDIIVSQDAYDIVLNFVGSQGDAIRISNALSNYGFSATAGQSMIESILFSDGRVWDAESVIKKTITPMASVNAQGNKITGTTPLDSEKVILRNAAGVEIGRVTPSGANFSISVNNALYSNQSVYVVALDASGTESPALKLIVPDKTAPVAPTASIDKTGTLVSGSSESGALIQVKTKSGILLGEAISDSSGAYSVLLSSAQINKQTLNVTAKDAANNLSSIKAITAPDVTAPSAPTAAFDTTGGIISGKAEAGSMVEVKNSSGVLLQKVAADIATGAYTITLSKALINKEIVNVIAIDNAGNASVAKSITAPDKTPPSAPNAQLDGARKIVSGTAEAGSTVKILDVNDALLKSTVANATTGGYSVTLTTAVAANQVIKVVAVDKSGNISLPAIVGGVATSVDTIAPDAPIAQFGIAGEVITGKAEAGSLVEVKNAATGNLLGKVTASATGDYSILLNIPLINKEVVHVTAQDAAGNISSIQSIIAPDKTPPAMPVMSLDVATKTLTGSSEPGATIIVKNAENNVIGSVKADSVTGNYQMVFNQTLVNGQLLFATATDDAGNTSGVASLQVIGTPPRQIISGLLGSYYGYEESANGNKDLTKLAQVQAFIADKAADATFIATNFKFGPGTNGLGMGENLQGFLKNDAASLSNDPLDTSDAILRFTGKIQLSSGSYNFRVRADDGYSIRINGQTVAEYNANGATTRTHSAFSVATTGLQDIEIIYWDSGRGHELGVEYKPAGGSYNYLNGSILSTESLQPTLTSAQFASSNTQSEQGKNILDSWFGSPGEHVTHDLVARDQPIKPHAQQLGTLIQSMAAFAPSSGVEGHLSVRGANDSPQLLAVGS